MPGLIRKILANELYLASGNQQRVEELGDIEQYGRCEGFIHLGGGGLTHHVNQGGGIERRRNPKTKTAVLCSHAI
jgi:hypothetical protein